MSDGSGRLDRLRQSCARDSGEQPEPRPPLCIFACIMLMESCSLCLAETISCKCGASSRNLNSLPVRNTIVSATRRLTESKHAAPEIGRAHCSTHPLLMLFFKVDSAQESARSPLSTIVSHAPFYPSEVYHLPLQASSALTSASQSQRNC